MAKGNAAAGMGGMLGGVGQGMGAAAGSMGGGGGGGGIGQGSSMGAYGKGMSPFSQQKSMYSQMQPQMQQNKQMPQMGQNDPFSQNNPYIGMSRAHAMNTGQEGGYNNFQKMMEPGFWDNMKQMMGQQRGMSGMLPPQGGNQQILPPSQSYGDGGQSFTNGFPSGGPMRAQAPGLQEQGGPMQAQMPMQEQQAQLPAYGGMGQGIRAQGGGGYGGGGIMNYLNPQRQGQVRF